MPTVIRVLLSSAAWALCANALAVASDVYKTVDAQGHVIYSDRALSPASKKITVDFIEGNAQDAARLSKELAVANADAAQRAKAAQQEAAEQQKVQMDQTHQQAACQAARQRYATFNAGGRIFRIDEQGNRAYYSDAEIEAQRTNAKATMDAACQQ